MTSWIVSSSESGVKLLNFLKDKMGEGYSSRLLKRSIESNLCEINGRVERFASTQLGTGDKVVLRLEKKTIIQIDRSRVLYEDDFLFFFNKPDGVASDGPELAKLGLELVHRLDKETTGVLIFAKSVAMRDKMFQLFREQQVHKSYLAIVDGIPSKKQGVIENFLGKLHVYQGQTLWGIVTKGLYAYTEWHLEKGGLQASLIRCFPKTGRTHQIRVHLASLGHPILGDYQYGRTFHCNYLPSRYLLHAESISFIHPETGLPLKVNAPLAADFQQALKDLKLS